MRLREGTLSFNDFARITRPRWLQVAGGLLRRWKTPLWLSIDDVLQDLYIEAWQRIERWDPTRGVSFEKYIVWCATDRAKKAIHRARLGRRMHRGEDQASSCFDRPFSTFVREGEDSGTPVHRFRGAGDVGRRAISDPPMPPSQLDILEIRRAFREAREYATSKAELLAVQAIEASDGDIEAAASLLYEDREARFLCELGSEREAVSVACKAATRVVGRMAMSAA